MIQSLLFGSPYSGDPGFSGWRAPKCPTPPGTTWPPQRNAPGLILSADSYRPGWTEGRVAKTVLIAPPLPPRAILTSCTPTQKGKFTIQGPSTAGAWTTYFGWDEKGTDEYGSASHGAGHNLGLG
jgi:hypothetical protein